MITNHFITRLGMAFNGNLIGHGTAGTKESGFHSKKCGGKMFQLIDGGIFSKNIVPKRGIIHGVEHPGGWSGYGVAPKIDHGSKILCVKKHMCRRKTLLVGRALDLEDMDAQSQMLLKTGVNVNK